MAQCGVVSVTRSIMRVTGLRDAVFGEQVENHGFAGDAFLLLLMHSSLATRLLITS